MDPAPHQIVAVSNGQAVMHQQLGAVIDCFEHVVRFNHAPLSDRFAPNLGTRTTIWACSDWPRQLYASHRARFADCRRLFVVPDIPGKEQVPSPPDAEAIPRSFERQLREQVRPHGAAWCTTGLITLAWLLREFDVIHTVGWFREAAAQCAQAFEQHYDTTATQNPECQHDVPAEAAWFRQRVEAGRLVELEDRRGCKVKAVCCQTDRTAEEEGRGP